MSHLTITVFLHALFAIAAVGTNIACIALLLWSRRQTEGTVHALKAIRMLDSRVAVPAYVLVLLTGLVMVLAVPFPITTPWILTGLALCMVIVALGIAVFAPAFRRQMQIVSREGDQSETYRRAARLASGYLGAVTVLAVLSVFLMIAKPPLWAG